MLNGAEVTRIDPELVTRNPNNPRRFFNDERLDLLRTSIQEVDVLVPLILYQDPTAAGRYVLMDGERRWRCALDLGLDLVPVNVIATPSPLENLVRMFNIHSVREDWPLISVALSLRELIKVTGEDREARLAEMTGLTRGTVRRAKRLLSIPEEELLLIQDEAHLDRNAQVHREDLYLEIEAAESVIRNEVPEVAALYPREKIIRSFAQKREANKLTAVTDFRDVGKLIDSEKSGQVTRPLIIAALKVLIEDPDATPRTMYRGVGEAGYEQHALSRKIELLSKDLAELAPSAALATPLREALRKLRDAIDRVLGK
jgi:ParB family transcriptional regulator, chromosome partitioning protein